MTNEKHHADLIGLLDLFQREVHDVARTKGWWAEERNTGELIALMHSELSEALEAARHDNPDDPHVPEFGNLEIELADVVIRVLDFCEARGLSLAEAMIAKAEFNRGREHKHGGKLF